MKIVVDNSGYELLNFGDIAMLKVALKRVIERWPGSNIYVLTTEPAKLKQICTGVSPLIVEKPDSRLRDIWIFPWDLYYLIPNPFRWLVAGIEAKICSFLPARIRLWIQKLNRHFGREKDRSMVRYKIENSDFVLITGGGFFTDSWHWHARKVICTLKFARNTTVKALMGQGIGPIKDLYLRTQLEIFKSVDIVALREKRKGYGILKSLGVEDTHISITGDDAIELAYLSRNNRMGDKIGFNLRLASYSGVNEIEKKKIKTIVNEITKKTRNRAYRVANSDRKK